MKKTKEPFIFTNWESIKPGFPFNFDIHEIKGNYEKHRHLFLEFSYVFEGSGIEIINGKKHTICPGAFTLILPYQFHEISSNEGETIKLFNCSIPLDVFTGPNNLGSEISELLFLTDSNISPYYEFKGEEKEKILKLLREMEDEYKHDFIWSNLIFKVKLCEVLILFDRLRKSNVNNEIKNPSKDKFGVWNVIYYIFIHYAEDITLQSLSENFFINPSYLSILFKKYFGVNITQFIREIRLLHTCSLLSSTNLPISQIAFNVGFKSYSSFCRVFTKSKGMSAAKYRKLYNFN